MDSNENSSEKTYFQKLVEDYEYAELFERMKEVRPICEFEDFLKKNKLSSEFHQHVSVDDTAEKLMEYSTQSFQSYFENLGLTPKTSKQSPPVKLLKTTEPYLPPVYKFLNKFLKDRRQQRMLYETRSTLKNSKSHHNKNLSKLSARLNDNTTSAKQKKSKKNEDKKQHLKKKSKVDNIQPEQPNYENVTFSDISSDSDDLYPSSVVKNSNSSKPFVRISYDSINLCKSFARLNINTTSTKQRKNKKNKYKKKYLKEKSEVDNMQSEQPIYEDITDEEICVSKSDRGACSEVRKSDCSEEVLADYSKQPKSFTILNDNTTSKQKKSKKDEDKKQHLKEKSEVDNMQPEQPIYEDISDEEICVSKSDRGACSEVRKSDCSEEVSADYSKQPKEIKPEKGVNLLQTSENVSDWATFGEKCSGVLNVNKSCASTVTKNITLHELHRMALLNKYKYNKGTTNFKIISDDENDEEQYLFISRNRILDDIEFTKDIYEPVSENETKKEKYKINDKFESISEDETNKEKCEINEDKSEFISKEKIVLKETLKERCENEKAKYECTPEDNSDEEGKIKKEKYEIVSGDKKNKHESISANETEEKKGEIKAKKHEIMLENRSAKYQEKSSFQNARVTKFILEENIPFKKGTTKKNKGKRSEKQNHRTSNEKSKSAFFLLTSGKNLFEYAQKNAPKNPSPKSDGHLKEHLNDDNNCDYPWASWISRSFNFPQQIRDFRFPEDEYLLDEPPQSQDLASVVNNNIKIDSAPSESKMQTKPDSI